MAFEPENTRNTQQSLIEKAYPLKVHEKSKLIKRQSEDLYDVLRLLFLDKGCVQR